MAHDLSRHGIGIVLDRRGPHDPGGGLGSGLLAWLAVAQLSALHVTPHDAGPLALLLALVAFVAGCAGAAGMVMGRHLLDTAEPGARWRGAGSSDR